MRNPEAKTYKLSNDYNSEYRHVRANYHNFKYFDVNFVDRKPVAVTKTMKWWGKEHQIWESRASTALEALQKLPQAKLKECLAQKYGEIMELRMVKIGDDFNKSESTSKREDSYQTTSIVPQKRSRDES